MKRFFLLFFLVLFGISCAAQQDTSLIKRLNAMLSFTQTKDLEKVMEYTYPKIFTIVPRNALVEALKNAYDTDEFTIELDSAKVDSIYPIFKINDTSYAKVTHSMLMRMKYKVPFDTADKSKTELMVSMMEEKFGEGNVRFDAAANSLNIFMIPDMVAIKTKNVWTFANLDEDNPQMLNLVFSKAVLDKLKEFK